MFKDNKGFSFIEFIIVIIIASITFISLSNFKGSSNKTELINKSNEIQEELNNLNKDNYSNLSWLKVEKTLDKANRIKDDEKSTEKDVSIVIEELDKAIDTLFDRENSYREVEIEELIDKGYVPIASADELQAVAKNNSDLVLFGEGTKWEDNYNRGFDKKYIQVVDIDLSNISNFEPIGSNSNRFTGIYNGGDFTISNLTIDRTDEDNIGLFGATVDSKIENIGLIDVDIRGKEYTGGLVGASYGNIINSFVTGNIKGGEYTGGLVGASFDESISNSSMIGKVEGTYFVGGLVGINLNSQIGDSYVIGDIKGNGGIGGLVGQNKMNSSIDTSYTEVNVKGGVIQGG